MPVPIYSYWGPCRCISEKLWRMRASPKSVTCASAMVSGKVEKMPAGSTILRIEERAYFMQDEEWVRDRKPRLIEDSHPHYHYVYGMGDKALDVSEAYGVSIGYSDLKDLQAGFHLRYLYTGEEVEKQKI